MFQTSCLCSLVSLLSLLCVLSAQEPCTNTGDIRLVGGSTRFEGRIEVCLNNVWGTVCDDSLGSSSTTQQINNYRTVVCRQLGLVADENGNLTTGIVDTEALFDPASVPIHLDKVMCTGDERGIIDCYHSNGLVANCTHRNDTGIVCSPGCVEGSIRLADGDSYNSGRVELCYNESWSTVADVTPDTANVICRQLGFSDTGTQLQSASMYGQGFGQIVSIACQGDEVEFSVCNVSTTTANYNHSRDSGVMCERCVDRCDLGSTCEACLVTTASTMATDDATDLDTSSKKEEEMTSQESTATIANDGLDKRSAATNSCYAALGAVVGIFLVLLLIVITGWITTCILFRAQAKGRRDRKSVRNANVFEEREFQNTVYEDGYANIGPTSPSGEKMDKLSTTSNEYALNESYGKFFWHREMSNFGQEELPRSKRADYELVESVDLAVRDSPMLKAENPLYQTVEIVTGTTEEEDDYCVLDSEGRATEEPVESRPRKNKKADDEEDYDELER